MTKLSESALEEFVEKVEPTGSRVICNPPPMDTDEDFLVKLKPNVSLKFFEQQMQFEGFEGSSGDMYDLDETIFVSLRKEETNLIVTTNQEFFDKMVLATAVAKRLNVMEKKNRIMLFNAIVRGEAPRESIMAKTSGLTWYDDVYNPPQLVVATQQGTMGSNIAMGEFVTASEHAASVWTTLVNEQHVNETQPV